ncbi:hypothetical protein D3C81_1605260 [compost metagenome]
MGRHRNDLGVEWLAVRLHLLQLICSLPVERLVGRPEEKGILVPEELMVVIMLPAESAVQLPAVPEFDVIGMEGGCLVAVLLQKTRQAGQLLVNISHGGSTLRWNVEGRVNNEFGIGGVALADHLIEIREIQTALHQTVQIGRNLLSVYLEPQQEALE